MSTTKETGKIKFFKKDKGFGFIINNRDNSEIFFHITNCKGMEPAQGNDVEYNVGEGKAGKGPSAIDIIVV